MGAGYQLLANYQLLDKQIIIDNELANVISNDGSGLRVLLSSGVVKNIHDEDFLVPYRINFISNEMYEKKVPYIAKFHGITNHRGQLVFPDEVTVKDKIIELFYDADHPNDRTVEEYTKEAINDFFKPNIDVSISGEEYTKRWHDNETEWLDSKEIFCKLNIAKEAKSHLEDGGIISEMVLLDGTILHRIGLRDNYIG